MTFNFFQFAFDVINKITDIAKWIYGFLFTTFEFGFIGNVQVWQLLGGALTGTLIIAGIVKAITPLL